MTCGETSHIVANLAAHRARWGFEPRVSADTSAVRVEPSTGPWPRVTLRTVDDRWLRVHSDREPLDEAARWIANAWPDHLAASLVCIVGAGCGYVLDVLEERIAPATKILVLEPEPAFASLCLGRRDWTRLIEAGRLMILSGPSFEGSAEAWRLVNPDAPSPVVLGHPVIADARPKAAREAAHVVRQAVTGARANEEARRKFAGPYLVNTLRNLPAIARGHDVRVLTEAFRGTPAIIAAAGPSLDTALSDLARLHDQALLIAVDTALRPLLDLGIAPRLAVGIDPSAMNARHFQLLPECPETWLVSESALEPSAASVFDNRTFWFRASNHHPWPWLREVGVEVGQLDVWGSVLTAAFQVARLAGCDPIVFVGADLAFTGGRPYCRGTTYEFDWAWTTSFGTGLEDVWRQHIGRRETCRVADVHGTEAITTPALLSFRDWIIARAAHAGRRVVNASGAGILVGEGIEQSTLAKVLFPSGAMPSLDAIARAPRTVPDHAGLAGHLRALGDMLVGGESSGPLPRWVEVTSDRVGREEIDVALSEAAAALESPTPEPWLPSTIPWSPSTPGIFRRLPEVAARFRAGLNGVEPLPEIVDPPRDPTALLVDAWTLLRRIRADILRVDDVGMPAPGPISAVMPVSASYPWLDTTRRAVQMFEALLGQAWASMASKGLSAFFIRPIVLRDNGSAPPVGPWSDRPHAMHACTLLAFHWLRCAAGLGPEAGARLRHSIELSPYANGHPRTSEALQAPGEGAAPAPYAWASQMLLALQVPPAFGEAALTRVLTGTIRAEGRLPPAPVRVTPRILTDEGIDRAAVAYATARGVVCVTPGAHKSFLLTEDGFVEPHHAWPRPINNELPFGVGGAVAWSNGTSRWPEIESACVMYRRSADDRPTVQELPVRPAIGAWWRERLYWNCFPTPDGAWVGVASWAPNEDVTLEVSGPTLFGMHPTADGLALEPCVVHPDTGYERRRPTHGWTLKGDRSLDTVTLGPDGAVSSRAVNAGWTAVAYPESDLIRLESCDGRSLRMICYYPLRVAWVGGALFVSTAERELLLFEHLIEVLEREGTRA